MPRLTSILVLVTFAASAVGLPPAPLPRKSPEFTINEPGGKTTTLSSFKGKVVVIEFLFVGSQHCLRVATTLDKLYRELGPRGFQPIGIAFGPEADAANVYLLSQTLKLTYAIGYSSNDNVDTYLARGKDEVLNIPQVVVIDRAGMIRAQSGGRPGDAKLENEDSLRALVEGLLKDSRPSETAPSTQKNRF